MESINLSAAEAAKALGIGTRTLWQLTKDGKVPHLRLGGRVIYPRATLTEWVNEQARKTITKAGAN